jgi:hypothetical protein
MKDKWLLDHFYVPQTEPAKPRSVQRMVRRQQPMKTEKEIEAINEQRKEAMQMLASAAETFAATGCSLGAHTIRECIGTLISDNCHEY